MGGFTTSCFKNDLPPYTNINFTKGSVEGAVQALLEILSPHGPKSRLFAVTPGVTFRALKTPWEQDWYQVTIARTRAVLTFSS